MCQCRFIPCTTAMWDVNNGRGYACVGGGNIWEISVTSSQFCCESKNALKKVFGGKKIGRIPSSIYSSLWKTGILFLKWQIHSLMIPLESRVFSVGKFMIMDSSSLIDSIYYISSHFQFWQVFKKSVEFIGIKKFTFFYYFNG